MKTQISLILFILLISPIGCTKDEDGDTNDFNSDSFYPMSIGNYWKMNDENFTKIVDTLRIQGNLFYKFYSLIGGDMTGTEYFRIDDENNLIGGSISNPEHKSTHAKFNSSVEDTFYLLNDILLSPYRIVMTFKNDDTIKFEWETINHPNLHSKFTKTYKRGFGLVGNWKEVCINNKVITIE